MNDQHYTPAIIALPKGFPITTNAGLHGNMQFFEMGHHQLTTSEAQYSGDRVSYIYRGHDSDEGQVTISYVTTCGSDADDPEVDGWDVEITTGSDVWGLAETATAIADAVALHQLLGRNLKP